MSNNSGGVNNFYEIEKWVIDVDDLCESKGFNSAEGNIQKALFGIVKDRHSGTNDRRDAKKIVHYGIRTLMRIDKTKGSRADILAELFFELKKKDAKKFIKRILNDKS